MQWMVCVLCVAVLTFVGATNGIPIAHTIPNVPYHMQETDYSCGDAGFQMVMGYYGFVLDQESIMDVLRTSDEAGTFSMDLVRGGQFSHLSNAQGKQFPSKIPLGGWDHASMPDQKGMAAFGYRQMFCWLDELKATIARNIPAIILMEFGDVPHDGHFRVLIGYNDTSRQVTMLDPWDRGYPKVVQYSYEVFCGLWGYDETNGNITYDPNFAAIIVPWNVTVDVLRTRPRLARVVATIEYVCPSPFCNGSSSVPFVATNVMASVTLPSAWSLLPLTISHHAAQANNTINIGQLAPGRSVHVKWDVQTLDDMTDLSQQQVQVDAWGLVTGSLPKVPMLNSTTLYYPAYTYTDVIGGVGRWPRQ